MGWKGRSLGRHEVEISRRSRIRERYIPEYRETIYQLVCITSLATGLPSSHSSYITQTWPRCPAKSMFVKRYQSRISFFRSSATITTPLNAIVRFSNGNDIFIIFIQKFTKTFAFLLQYEIIIIWNFDKNYLLLNIIYIEIYINWMVFS